jgi:hypothetical protein
LQDVGIGLDDFVGIGPAAARPVRGWRAARSDVRPAVASVHPRRPKKFGVFRPAMGALGQADFVFAQGVSMGCRCIDLMRRAITDMAVGRPPLGVPKCRERILDLFEVIGIANPQHVPAVSQKAHGYVFGEGDACVAIDRDVVVVVDPAEIVETKVTGQRGRLRLRLSFSEIPAPLRGRLSDGRTCEFSDCFSGDRACRVRCLFLGDHRRR